MDEYYEFEVQLLRKEYEAPDLTNVTPEVLAYIERLEEDAIRLQDILSRGLDE